MKRSTEPSWTQSAGQVIPPGRLTVTSPTYPVYPSTDTQPNPANDRWEGYLDGMRAAGTERDKEGRERWASWFGRLVEATRDIDYAADMADKMLVKWNERFAIGAAAAPSGGPSEQK